MILLCWDASALAKCYAPELGSESADFLFETVPISQHYSTSVSFAEICSILVRKYNRGIIDRATFGTAKSAMRIELINDSDFQMLELSDDSFYNGVKFIENNHLNATDAAILSTYLDFRDTLAPSGEFKVYLIAYDSRLLRVAAELDFSCINPESVSVAELAILLSIPTA